MSDYSFIAVADVHLGCKLFNLPELAADLKEDFARAVDLAIKHKVTYFFIAGDLFDINTPPPDLVHFVSDQVKRLGANGCIAAGIAGDHDKPINNATWIHLSKVIPVNSLNDPRFVGFDYCDESMLNVEKLKELETKEETEWVFLHGHVPGLFGFCSEKKLLDFKQLDLVNDFPKLKGVVLGDIHQPTEGEIHDPLEVRKDLPYIGYCGSLGMVKTNEIGHKKGLLHYDGTKLSRLPFELSRTFIKIILREAFGPINWVVRYSKFFTQNPQKKKPLIVVEYSREDEHLLPQIAPLYDVGIVKLTLVSSNLGHKGEKEVINIRSELKASSKLSDALTEEFEDKDIRALATLLIEAEDPTTILDEFKTRSFTNGPKPKPST